MKINYYCSSFLGVQKEMSMCAVCEFSLAEPTYKYGIPKELQGMEQLLFNCRLVGLNVTKELISGFLTKEEEAVLQQSYPKVQVNIDIPGAVFVLEGELTDEELKNVTVRIDADREPAVGEKFDFSLLKLFNKDFFYKKKDDNSETIVLEAEIVEFAPKNQPIFVDGINLN